MKNEGTTIEFAKTKVNEGYIFNNMYDYLASLKSGFLESCKKKLSIIACFIKRLRNGQVMLQLEQMSTIKRIQFTKLWVRENTLVDRDCVCSF